MGLNVVPPSEAMKYTGGERLYPIPERKAPPSILYDKRIQKTSYIQANIVAVFDEWIRSFFEPNYFTFTRIKTQSTYNDFKSFMKQIYKKDKPFLVIDPSSVDIVEDFIFAQNMTNRYNFIDPKHDNFGAKLLYSIPIMKDDSFELVYRRNRYKFEFEILIMEDNLNRQTNTYNMLTMNIRHNSKFLLNRTIPHLLPSYHIKNIAKVHKMDWQSEEFLHYMNTISQYPIIKRIMAGQVMFFMEQNLNIQVEVQGLPSKDSVEKSEAIEWGARITDSFTFIVDLPTEFLFMIPEEELPKIDKSIPDDPDSISYISPIYADMDWPTSIGEYRLANRVDIMPQEGDNDTVDLKELITTDDKSIRSVLVECLENQGNINDFVCVKVYQNGSMNECPYTFNNDCTVTMIKPEMNKLYTINIYLNLGLINKVLEAKNTRMSGTIEVY